VEVIDRVTGDAVQDDSLASVQLEVGWLLQYQLAIASVMRYNTPWRRRRLGPGACAAARERRLRSPDLHCHHQSCISDNDRTNRVK
jgi:hypothetical protein